FRAQMKIRIGKGSPSALADLAAVLVAEGVDADGGPSLRSQLAAAKASGDLKATFRSAALFRNGDGARGKDKAATKGLLGVGLGKAQELDAEKLRRAAALMQSVAEDAGVARFALVVAAKALGKVGAETAGAAFAEGLILGAYRYQPPQKEKPKERKGQDCEVVLLGGDGKAFARGFSFGEC